MSLEMAQDAVIALRKPKAAEQSLNWTPSRGKADKPDQLCCPTRLAHMLPPPARSGLRKTDGDSKRCGSTSEGFVVAFQQMYPARADPADTAHRRHGDGPAHRRIQDSGLARKPPPRRSIYRPGAPR